MSGVEAADRADLDRPRGPPPAPEPVRHHPLPRRDLHDPGARGPGDRSGPLRWRHRRAADARAGSGRGRSVVRSLDRRAPGAHGRRAAQQRGADRGLPAPDRAPRPGPPRGHRDQPGRARRSPPGATASGGPAACAARSTGSPSWSRTTSRPTTRMETTAGSLALVGSRVPRDARRGRPAARRPAPSILGKANLSEWANFRGLVPPAVTDAGLLLNGWSARGGLHAQPVRPRAGTRAARARARRWRRPPTSARSPSAPRRTARSSARRAATRSSASSRRSGWSPRTGSSRSRTARTRPARWRGPSPTPRSLLNVLRSPFGEVAGARLPRDYRASLRRGALRGARIGVDRRLFAGDPGADAALNAVAERAFDDDAVARRDARRPDRAGRHEGDRATPS